MGDGMLGRYEDLGEIARGGAGAIHRVRDPELRRTLAMKILRQSSGPPDPRFVDEAQATAQLQHPGVVPIHELGQLPDGRWYYTMEEVRGQTFEAAIQAVHQVSTDGWATTGDGWSLRRLVDALRRVAEAVAYAHEQGVLHRDLKPRNVMLGAFGEVRVLDWGLVKVVETASLATDSSVSDARHTRYGVVAGTPAYMAPEQAMGQLDRLGPHTDVHALGALLHEVLAGTPPYTGPTGRAILAKVRAGPPNPPSKPWPLPDELVELVARCTARAPSDRPADAGEVARALGAWLDGARATDRARALCTEADEALARSAELAQEAARRDRTADDTLRALPEAAPVDAKAPAWAEQDAARELAVQARVLESQAVQLLESALRLSPDLADAHRRLADHYQGVHARAEQARDRATAAVAEARLRAHDRGRWTAWIAGQGTVALRTEPPGARLVLHRYVERDRRLEPELHGTWDTVPDTLELPHGSYRFTFEHPDAEPVVYPVDLPRGGTWDTTDPDGVDQPVRLPARGSLGPDEIAVPAGWFRAGGDPACAPSHAAKRLWVDRFAMHRHPVTNGQYIAFLDHLVDTGREAEALRFVPRERAPQGSEGAAIYGRDEDGHFCLVPDADGDVWLSDYPVCMIDWYCAHAYCVWLAERDGLPWRLPEQWEWEKAARGVDGRCFPWGNHFDPTWAHTRASHTGRPLPATIHDTPGDVSPYGFLGLAGNVKDWCQGPHPRKRGEIDCPPRVPVPSPPPSDPLALRSNRGGNWLAEGHMSRAAQQFGYGAGSRFAYIGIRPARSL